MNREKKSTFLEIGWVIAVGVLVTATLVFVLVVVLTGSRGSVVASGVRRECLLKMEEIATRINAMANTKKFSTVNDTQETLLKILEQIEVDTACPACGGKHSYKLFLVPNGQIALACFSSDSTQIVMSYGEFRAIFESSKNDVQLNHPNCILVATSSGLNLSISKYEQPDVVDDMLLGIHGKYGAEEQRTGKSNGPLNR